jgi:hypothetical protein
LGFSSRKHLNVWNAVSSGESFFTTHFLMILSTSSSSAETFFSLILVWSIKISPDSLIRPAFFPKQRPWALILSSTTSNWLLTTLLMASSETPVSWRHSSLHFFHLAFCSSVNVYGRGVKSDTIARETHLSRDHGGDKGDTDEEFHDATVLSIRFRGVFIRGTIGFGVIVQKESSRR